MGIIERIKQGYQNFNTARWNTGLIKRYFPGQKHVIEHAFTVAGRDYFTFNDVFAIPYERGLTAIAVYEETRMKVSLEYLQKHVEAVDGMLHKNPVDVYVINALNEQLKERLNLSLDVDLLYKLASVVFFDKSENPCLYDADYCTKKIAFWKQHKGVADFFFQKPLLELIPFLKSADFDLSTYSELNQTLNEIHSERLHTVISKN